MERYKITITLEATRPQVDNLLHLFAQMEEIEENCEEVIDIDAVMIDSEGYEIELD